MAIFNCLRWPEMRDVTLALIARVHEGHARGRFSIPVVEFARLFAAGAPARELAKLERRGLMEFVAEDASGGTFSLQKGERALCELGREGLVMRVPARMSGHYSLRPGAFHIEFKRGEELEGCKRILLLVCHRVLSVDVSDKRVDVRLPSRLFDLCVEFE